MMAMGDGPLADRRPDAPRHRFQADAMLIGGEDFDRFVGFLAASSATVSASFFEGFRLFGSRRFGIFRARLLDRPAARAQRFPAALRRHPGEAQFASHPACCLAARPDSAVGRRIAQTNAQQLQQLRLQDRRRRAVGAAQIAQSPRTFRVVALKKLLDPALPERCHRRDIAGRMPLRQKPDRLKMPRRRYVRASLVTLFQRRNAQMRHDSSHVRLPRFMASKANRFAKERESPPFELITRKPYQHRRKAVNETSVSNY